MRHLTYTLAVPFLILATAAVCSAQAAAPPAVSKPAAESVAPTPGPIEARHAAEPAPAAALPAPATSGPEVVVAQGKGLTVTSADKRFQASFRTRAQLRESFSRQNDTSNNEVSVRTLRFWSSGYLFVPEFKYLIQLAFGAGDFESGNPSPIFDAYLEYTKIRDLNVRFGQYFVPFDRARTIREFALQFVDRQVVVRELSLDRDVGLMLSSSDLFGVGSRLAYNVFLGAGDGRNRVNDSIVQKPSVLIVGRLIARPFGAFDDDQEGDLTRSPKPHLAIGIAGAFNKATSRDRSTLGNIYQKGTFDYAHAAADLVFKWHGFSLLSEFLLRQANRKSKEFTNADGTITTERSRSGFGYFVQAGQMVHSKVELTARWDDLHVRKGTDPALVKLKNLSGRQLGGGLNVYLNGHALKFQTDYFYTFGKEFDKSGRETAKPGHSFRVQVDATF